MSVRLENDSLYIVTQPLVDGAFHRALVLTDANGAATWHHWAQHASGSSTREKYISRTSTAPLSSTPILRYYKISGYTPDGAFAEVCRTAFPTSYATAQENRNHGLSCRAWIGKVPGILEERGFIVRKSPMAGVESVIAEHSGRQETLYLESFMKGQPYVPSMLTV